MVSLEDFVSEDLNDHTRGLIYQGLLENVYGVRQKLELVFNRYSIEIDFENDIVSIHDDIFEESESLQLNIKSFFNSIKC